MGSPSEKAELTAAEAAEEMARDILVHIHQRFVADIQDDTEYIRNVKSVLAAVDRFHGAHGGVIEDPADLKQRLYRFSKKLWLDYVQRVQDDDPLAKGEEIDDSIDDGYNDYYYDYIYNHGVYPR